MEKAEVKYNRYISETNFLKGKLNQDRYKLVLVAPTNSGKTKYLITEAKRQLHKFIFAVDTIALGKQLSKEFNLPFHYAENRIDCNTPQVITLYNHLGYFYSEENLDRVLIIDEIHSLITARKYRNECILDLIEEISYYDRVIGLTGTEVFSDWFNDYQFVHFISEKKNSRAILVHYDSEISATVTLVEEAIKNNRQAFVYIQSKSESQEYGKLLAALKENGITSIVTLNSNTINDETDIQGITEILEESTFSSKVLIATYSQGYSLKNPNVDYICFPEINYIDIVQSIARLRETPSNIFILNNATEEERYFDECYEEFYNGVVIDCRVKQKEANQKVKSERHFQHFVKEAINSKYLVNRNNVDYNLIALDAVQKISRLMQKDKLLLVTTLLNYNIDVYNERNVFQQQEEKRQTTPIQRETKTKEEKQEEKREQVTKLFSHLMFKKPVPKELKQIHDDYKELKSFIGEEKAREVMKTEYPEMSKQEFSKLIITEDFKQPIEEKTVKTSLSYKRRSFKRDALQEFEVSKSYTTQEIQEKVQHLAEVNGLEVKKHKEKGLLECIFEISRTEKMEFSVYKIIKEL